MAPMFFGNTVELPAFIQAILSGIVLFILGFPLFTRAYKALMQLSGNMELLVVLGTSAAYGLSIYMWKFSHHSHQHLYFESAAGVVAFIQLGKALEELAKDKTRSALKSLEKLWPSKARIVDGEDEKEVSINDLKIGDHVSIKPGERFPADGLILKGESEIDESMITGESKLIPKKVGDRVLSGSLNGLDSLMVEVKTLGKESTLGKIIRLVENAQMEKAPVQKLVDKVSEIFVPIIILISIVTIAWTGLMSGDWETAIIHGVSVLVIACPCALGLATPTAVLVGMGGAAKNGILIKDSSALEIASSINVLVFDKTGTLTKGTPEIISIDSKLPKEEILKLLVSIQKGSEHPLAQATLRYANSLGVKSPSADKMSALKGVGVEAIIGDEKYFLGSEKLFEKLSVETPKISNPQGDTLAFLLNSRGDTLATVHFQDEIKPESAKVISDLQKDGIKVIMITGDHPESAARIAKELKLDDWKARVLPEDKVKVIAELKNKDSVVGMVGDGINDAAALSRADIGFAMSTGTDVAIESSDVTLLRGDLSLILESMRISHLTIRKVKQNLFWALIYNMVGIPLAATGVLNPMIAGLAMALSSVSVVTNSLLLRRQL